MTNKPQVKDQTAAEAHAEGFEVGVKGITQKSIPPEAAARVATDKNFAEGVGAGASSAAEHVGSNLKVGRSVRSNEESKRPFGPPEGE